ncbi:helix-turn-helix domain-containing protein [Autumnicola musiva]|uniref:Helix-turn-helix domain-containing protein n=1 Tax=Autumnicola musiva TaxID=3075589 RepID=A0ABU3D7Z2_9FLAO|nr:helix-turn-helix domain-containing protein [Zunongwangia sp. F117]MDT0677648.1 helix-turn-helix domain-containing protein [Zunongwangia sp. F117]
MENRNICQKIKELRIIKRLSQEQLSDLSGLSVRTIQRIEKAKVKPTPDSIARLSNALNSNIISEIEKDSNAKLQLTKLVYLSSLSFIIFPLLGAIIPTVIWIWKKNDLKEKENVIKHLLNFQLTWCILLPFSPVIIIPTLYTIINTAIMVIEPILNSDLNKIDNNHSEHVFVWIFMYLFNIYIILMNTWRLDQKTKTKLVPKISFIK